VTGVLLESGEKLTADAVIVATGGQSYPTTGSTGDGWDFAEATGHMTKPAIPALTPIETVETWPYELSGLSLKNVRLTAPGPKKKPLYSELGEMLLTHFGISGPLALSASSYLPEESKGAKLILDLKPALTDEQLDQRLLRDFKEMSRKQIISVMDGLAPHALAMEILGLCGIAPTQPVNGVTQEMRASIIKNIKRIELTVKRLRPLTEAIVTRGGVSVKDVNPSTMGSKKIAGLYFAGETLDIDALTGGFNLQLAFSTGALAGSSAAQEGE
jgi:predicted Rossmann fold flavoprotein